MSSQDTIADWPDVSKKLDFRRFSSLRHLTINTIAVALMGAAILFARPVLPFLFDQSVEKTGLARSSAPNEEHSTATAPRTPDSKSATIKDAPTNAKQKSSATPKQSSRPETSDIFLYVFASLVVVAVIFYDAASHYQIKTAIHTHHSDIDKIVIPQRTKCHGDSKTETDANKKAMTETLETHQIRDYRDTRSLLARQAECVAFSFAPGVVAVAVTWGANPFESKNDKIFALFLFLFLLLSLKFVVAVSGIQSGLSERRVFPRRERMATSVGSH